MEYRGANIKFLSLKPSHKEVTLKLKITDVENENISFVLNVTYYSLEPRAYDEAQEIILKGYISDFDDNSNAGFASFKSKANRENSTLVEIETLRIFNDELKAENKGLQQQKKDLEKELQSVKDFNRKLEETRVKLAKERVVIKDKSDKLIATLQDQHQQDCIRINDLTTTVHVLAGLYSALRKNVGMD